MAGAGILGASNTTVGDRAADDAGAATSRPLLRCACCVAIIRVTTPPRLGWVGVICSPAAYGRWLGASWGDHVPPMLVLRRAPRSS
jgi:hypothetical protein